ncbi:A2M domain-containing protein, partial [Haematococcus lacustris]
MHLTLHSTFTLQVVYSRPVIALGSDFGQGDPSGGRPPFSLSCPSSSKSPPGRFRWVTTTIARWDPDQDWPSDLDCTLLLNTSLTTYDGVPLNLTVGRQRKLVTRPISFSISTVISDTMSNLTEGLWQSQQGMPDDILPEVPPDAKILLSFTSPVNLTLLASSLQLRKLNTSTAEAMQLSVSPCSSVARLPPMPLLSSSRVAGPQSGLATCAEVVVGAPGLANNTKYLLLLPAGSRYNTYSAPTRRDLNVSLGGLRPFRVPLRQDFRTNSSRFGSEVKYRRLNAWLPHGLANTTTPEQLLASMSVCEVVDVMPSNLTCTPLTIESGRLLNKATLQLTVPGLLPKRKYRVAVAANQAVRDGLGQPLQASSAEFMTMELPTYTQGPTAESKVLVFEPASFPSSWPYLVQGESYRAESWSLDIASEADAIKLLPMLGGRDRLVSETLGRPSNRVLLQGRAINSTSLNTSVGEVALPLQAGRAVHVVATCCRQLNWDGGRSVSSDVQVLLKTGIQTSWVMSQGRGLLVWVVGNGSPGSTTPAGPVAGARAWVFAGVNSWTQDQGLTAVVVAPAGDVMITPSVGYWTSRSARSDYVAAVVLDRSLARPGDQLHALLLVQPSWDDSQPGNPASGDYGSMHGVFAVPASAKPGRYSMNLLLAPSGDLPPDANGTAPPTAQGRRLASLISSSSAQTLLSGQDPLATPGADSSTEYLDAEPLLARDSL